MIITCATARWVLLVSATLVLALHDTSAFFLSPTIKSTVSSETMLHVSSSWSSSSSSSSSKWSPSPMGSSVSAEPRVSSVRAYSTPSSNMWNARNPAAGRNRKNCYYKMLGVSVTADSAELKQAFRRLVKQYHPGKLKACGNELQWHTSHKQNFSKADSLHLT
jgi:DnaJ domain